MKLILFISLFFVSFFGISQTLNYAVFGKITNNDTKKSEAGVTISFLSSGKVLNSVVTASNGKYELLAEGPIGGNFQIVYSKPGFVTKKVALNGTKMSEAITPSGSDYPLPLLDMVLFTERPNVDFSFLNSEPVATFFWDESTLVLDFDRTASAKTKKKIEDLLAAAPAGPSPDDAKYQAAIKAGEGFYTQKKYQEALNKYEEASMIKPKEPVPLAKISEIDKLLKAQKAEQLASQQADSEYKNLITAADNLRDQKKYPEAIAKYNEAIKKKDEAYPKGEIVKLNLAIKAASDKLAADKLAADKLKADKLEADKLAAEKLAADKLAASNKIAADKLAADKLKADKLEADKLAAEKLAADKLAATNKIAADKLAAEKLKADKLAADKLAAEKLAADKLASTNKLAADKLAADKLKADKLEADKLAADKLKADKLASDKLAADKLAADKLGATNKMAADKLAADKLKADKLEADKLASEKLKADKLAADKLKAEKLEADKLASSNKLAADKLAADKLKSDKLEAEKLKAEKLEADKLAAINKIAADKLAKDKLASDKLTASNLAAKNNTEKLVLEADKLFKQERFLDAKKIYESVLVIQSDHSHSIKQVSECDRLEKEKSVNQGDNEYKKLVGAADKKFNEKNYLKAKEYYERAVGIRSTDPYPKKKLAEIEDLLNPKAVTKVETKETNNSDLGKLKLEPLGIPYSKSITDGKEELKKAEIARETARILELKSGIKNVDDRAGELSLEKQSEHLENTKNVDNITTNIEKENSDKSVGHQDVIEANKKVSNELEDRNTQSNILENSDHIQAKDKMNTSSLEMDADNEDKLNNYQSKGTEMKKLNTSYNSKETIAFEKFEDKNISSEKSILNEEQKIIDKQMDDKASRKLVEDLIESTIKSTVQKSEDLTTNEGNEVLNTKSQIHDAEKVMGEKNENDMANSSEISIDLLEIKQKVQSSNDQRVIDATDNGNNTSSEIVNLNKIISEENQLNETNLRESTESLKESNKSIYDKSNDDYNNEMIKYLASQKGVKDKLNILEESTISSNDKLISHNEELKSMTASVFDKNNEDSETQKEKHLTAQQSIHDKKEDLNSDKLIVANSLGKEYPEGVSQESFTQNDENGLMKAVITRRIVVVGGKGDVYIRTQTLSNTTFSKNGNPSQERIWQKETQGSNLVRHY